ncbi:MAG: site-specific integrase [Desulfuromonadaceae bacterium]|nr:site-specific integrase [Desulfuromonadaceae bacterium]MDU0460835.1 site-specific integrase [Geobacteraceae bacterium]
MLEYWYKERRTLVDFRRGPLGPYMDGLAARMKERGYSKRLAGPVLGHCCLFNSFLVDQGITRSKDITPAHFDAFIDAYLADFRTTSKLYVGRGAVRGHLKHLLSYLVDEGVMKPPAPKPLAPQYRWVLEPYLRHLHEDRQLNETTIQNYRVALCRFLDGLGERASRNGMKALQADDVETHIKQHIKESPVNLRSLASYLRSFLRFCAYKGYVAKDYSGVIPSVPAYRLASLPKGMEDTDLQKILNAIPKGTAVGARDTAIMLLMMAYGIRGMSAVELRLEDIDWQRSTILIRARKGGKEVVLPLLNAVGEAIIQYLHHRPETRLREVFLGVKAPHFPLSGQDISVTVRKYMIKAGVKRPKNGSNTMRHSWAIRALADDSPMKAIADVLGHRCLNTTFIYAKTDLKMLRQVVMPWPEKR